MDRKVAVADLKAGMFVSQLDRPWLETPFLLQGFHIRSSDDMNTLRQFCQYVYINDTEYDGSMVDESANEVRARPRSRSVPIPEPRVRYGDVHPIQEEMPAAREIHDEVAEVVTGLIQDLNQHGKLEAAPAKGAVKQMTDSMLRNPDAFLWLRQLIKKDTYASVRAMDASVLAIALARQMGFAQEDIEALGLGGLLLDVGKVRVPSEILSAQRRLTKEEFAEVKRHVEYGLDIVRSTAGVPDSVIHMVATHHERFDGTGYPAGLNGAQIPLFGRMASVIDCYSAITSKRAYAKAISPHEAVSKLYEWRGRDFQEELVEKFIQTLGAYPTGSVVRLSNDMVGIVISQSRVRRLRPKVMVLMTVDKEALSLTPVIDLMVEHEDKYGRPLEIVGAVDPEEYGIDPSEYYL